VGCYFILPEPSTRRSHDFLTFLASYFWLCCITHYVRLLLGTVLFTSSSRTIIWYSRLSLYNQPSVLLIQDALPTGTHSTRCGTFSRPPCWKSSWCSSRNIRHVRYRSRRLRQRLVLSRWSDMHRWISRQRYHVQ
jgi:hypothetical protein